MPKTDGLVHISELSTRRVKQVSDVLKEGDKVRVKCIGMEKGKIKLSIKALQQEEGGEQREAS
jgi:polyribonucleotide nucleotidyltransferase